MLAMIWDSLAPLMLIGLGIACNIAFRHRDRTSRVWKLVNTIPTQIQAAWKEQPCPPIPSVEPPPKEISSSLESFNPIAKSQAISQRSVALLKTPALDATVKYMQSVDPQGRYLFPYGWFLQGESPAGTIIDLAFADLSETYNLAVISPQQYGKTSLVMAGFMALTLQHRPCEIKFAIIDPKDVDFRLMEHSAYTFLMVRKAEMLADAIQTLQVEMSRRADILSCQHLSTWQEYRGDDLPLLIVYVSELFTLMHAVGKSKLDRLLNELMGRGGTLGFRVIIDTYSLAHLSPSWRKLVSEHILGPSLEWIQKDYFSHNLAYTDILAQGAILPSQLERTNKAVFTVISDVGKALTVRAVYVSTAQRYRWFARLLPIAEEPSKEPVIQVMAA